MTETDEYLIDEGKQRAFDQVLSYLDGDDNAPTSKQWETVRAALDAHKATATFEEGVRTGLSHASYVLNRVANKVPEDETTERLRLTAGESLAEFMEAARSALRLKWESGRESGHALVAEAVERVHRGGVNIRVACEHVEHCPHVPVSLYRAVKSIVVKRKEGRRQDQHSIDPICTEPTRLADLQRSELLQRLRRHRRILMHLVETGEFELKGERIKRVKRSRVRNVRGGDDGRKT